MNAAPLSEVVERLESAYGPSKPLPAKNPFEMIVWENIVYLADDRQRAEAFGALKREVGARPAEILAAPRSALVRITGRAGILAENSADKLREAAEIAVEEFGGDLRMVVKRPPAEAKKALKKFPGIGDPGAEKILLFTGSAPFLALDSNALRVLVRLGFGEERRNYGATYRSVQQEAQKTGSRELSWLQKASQLLRRHGQETCKKSNPLCEECVLVRQCPFYRSRSP